MLRADPHPIVCIQSDEQPAPSWSFGKYVLFEIAKAAAVAAATEGARWVFEEVREMRKARSK